MLEVGDVYFLENQTELIEQLVNFPEVAHDDVMDSFVIALKKSLER
jgi:phage terminase large subunit-like protein